MTPLNQALYKLRRKNAKIVKYYAQIDKRLNKYRQASLTERRNCSIREIVDDFEEVRKLHVLIKDKAIQRKILRCHLLHLNSLTG